MRKILVIGWSHMYSCIKKIKEVKADFIIFRQLFYLSFLEIFSTNLQYLKLEKDKKIQSYDIIYLNNWESFLSFRKREGQVSIAESHGPHLGLNFDQIIKLIPIHKRILSVILKLFFTKYMIKKIKQFDIYYVSTPNLTSEARKIRKDTKWLPNPINMNIFNPKGVRKKLKGDPAIFLPVKFHAAKNVAFGLHIFKKIKEKYPNACLHYIKYGLAHSPLEQDFLLQLKDKKTYIQHKMMTPEELAKMYRSSDLVIGQFSPELGCLCLIELESMACKAPVIFFDKYELKHKLDDVEKIAFKILGDKLFRKRYVEKNYNYVMKVHSEKAVGKRVINDINLLSRKNKKL